ncbi:MAG: exopolyphosphatase [Flavobacteriaceae bacterium]|jgi:exopolyphosphatase / guanosine-5'-triphosphate,3'-diphosphate pyrophosphatase|nr:exopolyphosphatase [Bacteroidota bacterium]MDB2471493.1 exopolyphosphatase [Flavobacteriaceae bacterium]MDG1380514.1 exopolyphosphatase [Flavobacteriaceae bacterium]MDG2349427.1 exopolyphosphatase [Flavobacteriaceae bacterium]|tara:strand:- start:1185 stop:2090 length:906 start_codon:yes stop_codon:yes gene_type:complete
MLTVNKYAAIDIGSNAIRLLITTIVEESGKPAQFKKTSLVRVPIRLGEDVFTNGFVSSFNIIRLRDTMKAFKLLMKTHGVKVYKACATSAMREATNTEEILKEIFASSNIDIEVIDGQLEAILIASTNLKEYIQPNKTYLFVDVGGGSTEFSIIHDELTVASKSFKIGTIRLLRGFVVRDTWLELEEWIKEYTLNYEKVQVIGSGGNINKIFKISRKALGKPLTYFHLSSYYHTLKSYTYDERISKLGLNHDRADVIVPALQIYLSSMKWSKAKHIYVPKIGLSDGIIKSMFYNKVKGNSL